MKSRRFKEPDLTDREAEAFVYLLPVLAFAVLSVFVDLISSRESSGASNSLVAGPPLMTFFYGSQLAWQKGFKLRPLLSLFIFLFFGLGAFAKTPSDVSWIVYVIFWPLAVLLFVAIFNWRLGKNLR